MRKVKIGLVGCGTVGGGLVNILSKHAQDFNRKLGVDLELACATSRTKSKMIQAGIPEDKIVDSYKDVISNPEVDIVVELIGGTGAAADVVLEALNAGKYVVTANKALVASRGAEIFDAADKAGVEIAFEGAVGGGIPIIQPLKHALTGNEISDVLGIVNGTTNYMLSKMDAQGCSYDEVLKEAQELGYAEADPTADVDGLDAAAKIAILASIAFNSRVAIDDVYAEGIREVTPTDFQYAANLGYAIKLLAIAHRTNAGIDIRVHPTMIPRTHQLAAVNGVYNAVFVTGDAVGDLMFFGEGAGAGAAASAVMGDVVELARHISHDVPPVVGCTCTDALPLVPIDEIESQYYIRLNVKDVAGVLAATAQHFADNNVSIKSMLQEASKGDHVDVLYVTHRTKESSVKAALEKIQELPEVNNLGILIRIEEG